MRRRQKDKSENKGEEATEKERENEKIISGYVLAKLDGLLQYFIILILF